MTPANAASAETAIQITTGAKARNGAARRGGLLVAEHPDRYGYGDLASTSSKPRRVFVGGDGVAAGALPSVLASESAVPAADPAEREHWVMREEVPLRGRLKPTRLAVPFGQG